MPLFSTRPREMHELMNDKDFVLYVGRLIGANEMVAHWLLISEDAESKEMGRRLGQVVEWFLTGEPMVKPLPPPSVASPADRPVGKREP